VDYNFNECIRIKKMAKQSDSHKKEKPSNEFTEKVLYINRCSKVVKGGRKFSFSALILAGDGKGKIGYGFARANELTDAIRKGGEAARKNMVSFPIEGTTVPHEVAVHWDGASIILKPVPAGAGVIAGSKIRAVLEMAGYKDVMAKSLGASNPINQVKAIFKALSMLQKREKIKQMRGLA
jgi:small subunit ribosomal protein S5